MEDYRMKMHDIAEIVGISIDRMHNILHKELKMKKYTMDAAIADHRPNTHTKRHFAAVFVDT